MELHDVKFVLLGFWFQFIVIIPAFIMVFPFGIKMITLRYCVLEIWSFFVIVVIGDGGAVVMVCSACVRACVCV